MSFLIVPNEVSQTTATIWVAVINEAFDPGLDQPVLEYASRFGTTQKPLNDPWTTFQTSDGTYRIIYQRIQLFGLNPRTWHSLVFKVKNNQKADGSVITLPDRLPNAGDRPFTVLLGSCYFGREDKAGAVGQTFLQLPPDSRPEIKILCGDQVYLDNPPQDFIIPRGHDWLENRSFKTYADSWSQLTMGGAGGFGQMLKHEANFFSSDDHEFWNNAPDVGLNVPVFTARQSGRDTWLGIAHQLYRIFQLEPRAPANEPQRNPPIILEIPPISFCIADTRFNRDPFKRNGANLMLPKDFEEIGAWAGGLSGPGFLVVGQPLFDTPGSSFGKIEDCGLPDFAAQYEQLGKYLRDTKHSIVVLTGDVHYGRLSVANLRPELGTKLYEVISSPMQLVPHGGGNYKDAPQVFGAVSSQPEFSKHRNHFLTLDFMSPSAGRASVTVKFWPIIQGGSPLQSQVIGGPIELI